ncbi:MAG TPA: ADP-forming succinate--CoA ligase subunit beta [Candidatus Cloacimonetes bacterium]|nr:ADP-forming succinate--CoA ligase subunit beta [Candidatus Cloacimonadota bacterium]
MNIHEYQAKQLFKQYDVAIPQGKMAETSEQAVEAAEEIDSNKWAIKAQVHAGGRGKGGGVKIASSLEEVRKLAEQILGMKLITHQTGAAGKLVRKIYIEEVAPIQKEYYLGLVLDRTFEMPIMIASSEGGMEIEKVAADTPDKIIKVRIDPLIGFKNFHGMRIAYKLGLPKEEARDFVKMARALYSLYKENDASLIEINPLVLKEDGKFIALDAKINFDDNALFRNAKILEMRDLDEEEPTELEASQYGLNYVKLDGNVGCMVNGAGLAMSTMDIIKLKGGEPANFLDVGGTASAETVAKGFDIILRDKKVKAIFVNIFGGIVRCDRIAKGILEATSKTKVSAPLVVRLDGTNASQAAIILREANIPNIITAGSLAEGAQKAVDAARS